MDTFIICRTCKAPIDHGAPRNGKECRECCNARHRRWWANRSPEQRARRKSYKDGYYAYVSSPSVNRRKWLKRKHKMSLGEYQRLLDSQNGRCAICNTDSPSGKGNRFHIDHDHQTQHIRGLLCQRCNTGIGLLGDNGDAILRAARYLGATV